MKKKSNPRLFYHTKKGEINKGFENHFAICKGEILKRFKDGKLKSIIRIHISLPERTASKKTSKSPKIPKSCISYQNVKLGEQDIPSIIIDISGENIEQSGIFSQNIIKKLKEKSII